MITTDDDSPSGEYYQDNPSLNLLTELRRFRASHPTKQIAHHAMTWEYLVCGQGNEVILWLVGGLRVADAAFRSIPEMEDGFTIITPNYPAIPTMAELTDGLITILDAEGIQRVHVLSGSYGGMVGQTLMRRYPERVGKVILSNTSAPNPSLAGKYRQELSLIEGLPEDIVREGAKIRFLEILSPEKQDVKFWQSYLNELYTERLGKDDLVSTYKSLIDYMQNDRFSEDDMGNMIDDILIIASDNDKTFGEDSFDLLKNIYPTARIHVFEDAGHSIASTRKAEYFGLVRDFLQS